MTLNTACSSVLFFVACVVYGTATPERLAQGAATKASGIVITATPSTLEIRLGTQPASVSIFALPAHTHSTPNEARLLLTTSARSPIMVPRIHGGEDVAWQRIEVRDASTGQPLAPPQWTTAFAGRERAMEQRISRHNLKGLTCIHDLEDATTLGIAQVALNIILVQWLEFGTELSPYEITIDGQTFRIKQATVERNDRWLRECHERGFGVTGVFYSPFPANARHPHPLIHPHADQAAAPNKIGAINTATAEGVRATRALLEFLAERYASGDHTHGRLDGLVIGNELQSHTAWNNQGAAPAADVVRDHHVALRLADIAFRQRHATFRVYTSLDHHWTSRFTPNDPLRSMPGREFLEHLARASNSAGNFPWHVAFHPYPANLFDPRFWNDQDCTPELDTPKISFRNLYVLSRFLARPEMTYHGHTRRIALTEQGFNYNARLPDAERLQAAAYALAWNVVAHIPEVEAFHYHRHIDHPKEGGLQLGLRAHDVTRPHQMGEKRMIYEVLRAAGTPDEHAAFSPLLPVVGAPDWPTALRRLGGR